MQHSKPPEPSRRQPTSAPRRPRRLTVGLVSSALALTGLALATLLSSGPTTGHGEFRGKIPLRTGLVKDEKLTAYVDPTDLRQALLMYSELTGRTLLPRTNSPLERLDDLLGERLSRWHLLKRSAVPDSGLRWHGDGRFCAGEVKEELELVLASAGIIPVAVGKRCFRVLRPADP